MTTKKSVFNKFALMLALIFCFLISLCSIGCAPTTYIVAVHKQYDRQNCFIFKLKKGDKITLEMIAEKYPEEFQINPDFYYDDHFYIDDYLGHKFVGEIDKNMSLYFGEYDPKEYGKVTFEYKGEEYNIFRRLGRPILKRDFSDSAYGYGEPKDYTFYSDKEHTSPIEIIAGDLNITATDGLKIYVDDAQPVIDPNIPSLN